MRYLLVLCTVVLLLFVVGRAGATLAENRVEARINTVRVVHGRIPYIHGPTLRHQAHRRARYLRVHNLFEHLYIPSEEAEIIGWITCRSGWVRTMVKWWMQSDQHRPFVLSRTLHRQGAGVSTGAFRSYPCVRMVVVRFR